MLPEGDRAATVFISYSRRDMALVDRLDAGLQARGVKTLVDRAAIEVGERWFDRLKDLISRAETILFVLSPDSVGSKICAEEVAFGRKLHKRFIPVVVRRVEEPSVPEALSELNYVFLDDEGTYEAQLDRLVAAIGTDLAWMRAHADLGRLAEEWNGAGRPRGLLLGGARLGAAEAWIASRPAHAPLPTEDTRALIAASRRAARHWRNGLIGALALGLLVALGLAALAYVQRQDAVAQRQEADRQARIAGEQREEARKQEAEARRQTARAIEETRKAEQRAAILAANVGRALAEDGFVDQALLLLLRSADTFRREAAPDDMLIAFTTALTAAAGTRTVPLPATVKVFPTRRGAYLFDRATRNLMQLDGHATKPILEGRPDDRDILLLEEAPDGRGLIVLREGWLVEQLGWSGARATVRRLPLAGSGVEETATGEEGGRASIGQNGLVLAAEGDGLLHVLDAVTGQYFTATGSFPRPLALTDSRGIRHVSGDDRFYRVVFQGREGGSLQPVKPHPGQTFDMSFGPCLNGAEETQRREALKYVRELALDRPGADIVACRRVAGKLLVTRVSFGSAGRARDDAVIGEFYRTTIRAMLNDLDRIRVPKGNVTTVAIEPGTGRLAVLIGRDLVVLGDDSEVLLHKRHASAPAYAAFDGPDRVVVVDPEGGVLKIHDIAHQDARSLLVRSLSGDAASSLKLRSQQDACRAASRAAGTLPGGGVVSVVTGRTRGIQVVRGESRTIVPLPDDACPVFDEDRTRLMIVRDKAVVYDLGRVAEAGRLDGGVIGTLDPGEGGQAYFLRGSPDILTVSSQPVRMWRWNVDSSGRWRGEEVYRGKDEVFAVEPDAGGTRLVVTEQVGLATLRAYLYSLTARREWLHLGQMYKWLSAGFDDDGHVVVKFGEDRAKVFRIPDLAGMVAEARDSLSPGCRPPSADAYAASPCWPHGIE
ncbi:TIR domain-containing protein [Enterovirga sp.]|uniref:TIR domain-containing protein n=1 Tax=Enterovirga sp. TaxID=2026350 RepID=UPI002C9CC053|nr:TIR domain-containing protein [Enterovirga sp.]HMO31207.1 TIR domain-containing protein [Enterovirga sp.]